MGRNIPGRNIRNIRLTRVLSRAEQVKSKSAAQKSGQFWVPTSSRPQPGGFNDLRGTRSGGLDSDFVDSLLLRGRPWKLLSVTTGNIHNRELEALFLTNLETFLKGLAVYTYVELSRSAVILHF